MYNKMMDSGGKVGEVSCVIHIEQPTLWFKRTLYHWKKHLQKTSLIAPKCYACSYFSINLKRVAFVPSDVATLLH